MINSKNRFLVLKPVNGHDPDIGIDSKIMEYSVIYGDTIIGKNLFLGHHSLIRENNKIGNNVSIGSFTEIGPRNEIHDDVRIHSRCFLENTIIEKKVFIGPGVLFTDDKHPPCEKYLECTDKTIVKYGASIGAGSIILPGIEIGEGALIGAGSVVTKNVNAYTVVAGIPAKFMKNINDIDCKLKPSRS